MTDDERAARQRALVAAMRAVPWRLVVEVLGDIADDAHNERDIVWAALAAACHDGELWDAMSQLRQVVMLEQDAPTPRAREVGGARSAAVQNRAMTERQISEGTTVYLHPATGIPYAVRIGAGDRVVGGAAMRQVVTDIFEDLGFACAVGPFCAELGVHILVGVVKLAPRDVVLQFAYTEGPRR